MEVVKEFTDVDKLENQRIDRTVKTDVRIEDQLHKLNIKLGLHLSTKDRLELKKQITSLIDTSVRAGFEVGKVFGTVKQEIKYVEGNSNGKSREEIYGKRSDNFVND